MPRVLRAARPVPGVDTLGYVRVSTEQQATEQRTSLVEQRAAVMKRAEQMKRMLDPSAVFEDPGMSGATAEGRPGFMAMLAYCEGHPRPETDAGVILVLNDSRFGRFEDPEEATYWRVLLRRLGWVVRFCEGDDIENTTARMIVRSIGSAQASEYRANLKRTARRATRATAERGQWQNEAPLGYRRLAIRADGARRVLEIGQRKADDEIVRLTPGPDVEQEIVRWLFEQMAGGLVTTNALKRELEQRNPIRRWSRTAVQAIIRNPAYVGDVVWCRRPHDRSQRRRPKEDWIVAPDAHPPLVTRELFAAAGARLAMNKKATVATHGGYPLSGFIRCSKCGSHFIGAGGRRGPAHDPDRYRMYTDGSFNRRVPCPGRLASMSKRWLEPIVIAEVANVVSDERVQAVIAEELDKALSALGDNASVRRVALTKEKEQIVRQRDRVVAMIANDAISERETRAQMATIRTQLTSIDAELERLRFGERRVNELGDLRERVLGMARDFRALADRAEGPALRELIRPWLADAVFDKDEHVLTLKVRRVPEVLGSTLSSAPFPSLSGLRAQTSRQNYVIRRVPVPLHGANRQFCHRGHALTPDNVYNEPGRRHRQCRACRRMRDRKRRSVA
jgi:DNA invertase Pin-like site-specific DNA recombinase